MAEWFISFLSYEIFELDVMSYLLILVNVMTIWLLIRAFRRTYRYFPERDRKAVICGHTSKRSGKVTAFGTSIRTKMPLNEDGTVNWCLSCIEKMAIQCALCKKPIFIGDTVSLPTPVDPNYELPKHAVVYDDNPLQLVACARTTCCDTGALYAGQWLPHNNGVGVVVRQRTGLERATIVGPGGI